MHFKNAVLAFHLHGRPGLAAQTPPVPAPTSSAPASTPHRQPARMGSKEGTQVFLRVRPLNERERTTTAAARCLQVQDGGSLLYTGREAPACNQFGFDRVFGEDTTQAEAFEVCCFEVLGRQQRQRGVAACGQRGAAVGRAAPRLMQTPQLLRMFVRCRA